MKTLKDWLIHDTKNELVVRRRKPAIGISGRRIILFAVMACFCCSPAAAATKNTNTARARAILAEIDDLWRSTSAHSLLTMRVQTSHYTRTVRLEEWSKGKGKSLVRIISPRREQGVTTLKYGNDIYSYLPKTDRTIRLTSSMMMASWMGSHFTNDDLVKESRLSDDYDPTISFEGKRDGQTLIEFTMLPKPEAPVVWGKIVTVVRAADHLPLISRYYDDDMLPARTLTYSRIKEIGGRLLPTILRMVPADFPNEYTELLYEKASFDIPLDDSFFSLKQLRKK